MRFVTNSGEPSRLTLEFAPRASSRKSHAAHGASFEHHPKGMQDYLRVAQTSEV